MTALVASESMEKQELAQDFMSAEGEGAGKGEGKGENGIGENR